MLYLIYNDIIKRLIDFENIDKYINSYQSIFDKVVSLLIDTFYYIYKNTKIYFQAIILINIRIKCLAFVLAI